MFPSLKFYNDLAFNNKLEELSNSFYNNAELLDKGYFFDGDRNEYVNFELIDDSVNAKFHNDIINIEKFIQQRLEDNNEQFYGYLRKLNNTSEEDDFKIYLNSVYDDLLKIYFKIQENSECSYFDIILDHLIDVFKDLKFLFSSVIEYHRIFTKIASLNNEVSLFQFKELKRSFFEELYEVASNLNIIDDIVVEEDTFIDVFTTPRQNEKLFIIFRSPNYIVTHFLEEIGIFFFNLNGKTIGDSKMFLNKSQKPFTANDLYAAKSRVPHKAKPKLSTITSQIQMLQKKFL
ncbi:hypothetical protein [Dokdonia sp. Asnod2-E02]|uniref:hypothetical protein n=1 Tax=Dokdonia sp. Asnod2-E02 TaxID=3160574 RepID=UPI00386A4491